MSNEDEDGAVIGGEGPLHYLIAGGCEKGPYTLEQLRALRCSVPLLADPLLTSSPALA